MTEYVSPSPSWPVWQAHEKPFAVLVQTANGVTVNRADDALNDARACLAVPFVAGVASTREASNCVGAACINGTVLRPHDALNDVRARQAVLLVVVESAGLDWRVQSQMTTL